ncbi:hypothetical protein AWN90_37205 [Nocardia terpenica]|uniref:Uncharacterized protein n=1 Tax=Nocardia terpenica TaxID=455432 RepID=A0A164L088_9NOCA|nr:hypothetical protein AWN90_37205 [Nocardia terpenica]
MYNAVATGCVVKGEAPRKGATKKGQNLAIRSDDVESPAEGSDKAFTGRYLVACLKMDAGDGTGTVTGTHCHVVHPSGGEPLV